MMLTLENIIILLVAGLAVYAVVIITKEDL